MISLMTAFIIMTLNHVIIFIDVKIKYRIDMTLYRDIQCHVAIIKILKNIESTPSLEYK